jgi:hypothetical protein
MKTQQLLMIVLVGLMSVNGFEYEMSCPECLDFTHETNKLMNLNETQTYFQVNNDFSRFCNELHKPEFKQSCETFNTLFFPATYVMLRNGVKEYQACSYLSNCPMHVSVIEEHYEFGDNCDACEGLVELAETFVSQKLPEETVQLYLDSWCDSSSQYPEKCESIVNATLPLIFQYVGQHATPETLCQLAHFC